MSSSTRDQHKSGGSNMSVSRLATTLSVALLAGLCALLYTFDTKTLCTPSTSKIWPLSRPEKSSDGSMKYRLAVITDLDHDSKINDQKNTWQSWLRYGTLTLSKDHKKVSIDWESEDHSLQSKIASGGRAMELSDLCVFDGKLLTVDDRTGLIYTINKTSGGAGVKPVAVPWLLLNDGDGNVVKGFKAEWLAVKGDRLYVGGLGKEWTTTEGVFVGRDPMFIKIVDAAGKVEHVDFHIEYENLRSSVGIKYPGYMIHESARWSDIHQKWFFLPRRASKGTYTEADDEKRGTNYLLIADEKFDSVEPIRVTTLSASKGFSAFQFIPGTSDRLIVALKSEELDGTPVGSEIMVFDIDGKMLLQPQALKGAFKFEGIEFV